MVFDKLSNIEKLLFMINNGHIERYRQNTRIIISFKTKIKTRFFYFKSLIISIFSKSSIDNKINTWLVFETKNNHTALLPLKSAKNIFVRPNINLVYNFLFFYKILYFIPLIFYLIKNKKLKWFFTYFDTLGVLEESERLLMKYKPKKLIFSNDHNSFQVALRIKAQKLGIKTYYFQHACIGMNMPPLEFDVSFLDGMDTFNKYKKIGEIKGNVELIGMFRAHSKSLKLNRNSNVENIGIALNPYDQIDNVRSIVYSLLMALDIKSVIIRMHPADNRTILFDTDKVKFSNSKEESVFDFLENIDLLIAGDSSIHLEATLVNVVSIYFKFSKHDVFDIYEFVKNKLVYYANNYKNLESYVKKEIEHKTDVLERAQYYDEYLRSKVNYKAILKKYDIL